MGGRDYDRGSSPSFDGWGHESKSRLGERELEKGLDVKINHCTPGIWKTQAKPFTKKTNMLLNLNISNQKFVQGTLWVSVVLQSHLGGGGGGVKRSNWTKCMS